MPIFRYRAVSGTGEIVEGDMDAGSPEVVIERLRRSGKFPLNVDKSTGATAPSAMTAPTTKQLWRRVPTLGGIAAMTRNLSTLVRAGIPLDRSLRFARESAVELPLRQALERVVARVQGGVPLADAVQEQGADFPSFYSGMLRAGEAGGNLDEVLEELAAYLDRVHAVRESLRGALIYPAILLVMTLVTVVVMFVWVLPQFRPLFADLGDDLPLMTRGFMAVGDFVERWWWAGLLSLAAAVLALRYRLRDPAFRRAWDRAKLRTPRFGRLIADVEAARFARTLSMLLRGGLPLPEALRIVRDALSNAVFRDTVEAVTTELREGGSLTAGITRSGIFPAMAVQVIQVGEESGHLQGVLAELAMSLERETDRAAQRLLALLVPFVTILLGGIVALVIISVLGAFLSVNDLAY